MNNVTRSMRNWLAPLGLAFFVSACSDVHEVHYAEGETGELQFQIAYMPTGPNQTEVRMRERARGLVEYLEHQLSTAYEGSEVVRINQWHSTEAMVLTRDLEDFVLAGLEANVLTEGGLNLFSNAEVTGVDALKRPLMQIENHQLRKVAADVRLEFDSLLSGFVVDRLAILMSQMGIDQYQITVNGQRRSRRFPGINQTDGPEATDVAARKYALGCASYVDGTEVYVLGKTTLQASALAQWLATMTVSEALITAERLNLAVDIHSRENGSVKRYNSSAFP